MEIHTELRPPRLSRTLGPKKTSPFTRKFSQSNYKTFHANPQVASYRASTGVLLKQIKNVAIDGSLLPGNNHSDKGLHRASTGALPQNKTATQISHYGCRASTGDLKPCKGPKKRHSYHHILAGDLKISCSRASVQTTPNQESEKKNHCGRCGGLIKKQHFQCLNCRSFSLCAECGDGGIYCQDDNHSWVEKSAHSNGLLSQIIGKISPEEARTLYFGTRTFPSIFRPPSPLDLPTKLFANEHRFIRNDNPREILIFADGVCLQNSKAGPIAGWAFVYRPSAYSQDGKLTHAGTISGRLEAKGPTGKLYTATSSRAELRAAVAALQFLDWSKDCNRGWRSIVIATDSDYVTFSVTKWIPDWEDSKWKLVNGTDVNNKDLWELLLQEVRKYHSEGVKVAFWRIPRHCNARAHEFAKKATGRGYKARVETVKFQPDGPVKVQVTPFVLEESSNGYNET
ncbi:hypothetical protein K3495_g11166 [Podosphaera aphanis]|nr:hypothetical protein K3495_g11166 [Podosphaera aphanis]